MDNEAQARTRLPETVQAACLGFDAHRQGHGSEAIFFATLQNKFSRPAVVHFSRLGAKYMAAV